MKRIYHLDQLNWVLAGCTPHQWQLNSWTDIHEVPGLEINPIPVIVPGSVQNALLQAGFIPDWNQGLNAHLCEWVENRHWLFQTSIPEGLYTPGESITLECLGLDDRGWVLLNGRIIRRFENGFIPHRFELTQELLPGKNYLQIIFDVPPRWLGQFGYTSQMTEWKSRFYYTWDWVSRLVQIGIWDKISLSVSDGIDIGNLHITSKYLPQSCTGEIEVHGDTNASPDLKLTIELVYEDKVILQQSIDPVDIKQQGIHLKDFPIKPWWTNNSGDQPLYTLTFSLEDQTGACIDQRTQVIGFKSVEWLPCSGAPEEADPWICALNGKPIFLQGFNWTPIRPNFADVSDEEYRQRLDLYKELGVNVLRVWGGAYLEKEIFYELCDQYGILVWQDFPLSSSGVDNWPPEDEASIEELALTAQSYIHRRQHHVSLLCWCGGNELQGDLEGNKTGVGKPVDLSHPLIQRFAAIVSDEDPDHRFLFTTSSGPRFYVDPADIGKGVHWDVHGPWRLPGSMPEWKEYWAKVDALFHSEVGAPGCSPVDIIEMYSGGLSLMPASKTNPLWRRTSWWIEWEEFIVENGKEAENLQEYVEWSQNRQVEALTTVARSLKSKFPQCGGVIFWMGHDCFPCTANTSVIDFHGRPKPAALALKEIFTRP